MGEDIVDLVAKNWANIISTGIITALVAKLREYQKAIEVRDERNSAALLGIQALLRAEIVREHDRLVRQRYANITEKENMKNIFTQYNHLGANGVMDCLVEEVLELPICPLTQDKE